MGVGYVIAAVLLNILDFLVMVITTLFGKGLISWASNALAIAASIKKRNAVSRVWRVVVLPARRPCSQRVACPWWIVSPPSTSSRHLRRN
jgi:hypothetical protein